jgi:3-oxoacyl-[acyl-carrier protein] reductase
MSRSILVTGASRGIGRGIALNLAKAGFEVIVHYHSRDELAATCVDEIVADGGSARTLGFDIADREGSAAALQADVEAHGAYYGVVLNAGVNRDQALPMMSAEEWDTVVHTNLDGFYNVLRPVILPMIRRRAPGRIVVLSSVSGMIGNRGQTNYAAAKAGLIGAAKSLALELAKREITVNCIAPGLIETEMTSELPADLVRNMVPLRRMGRVEEVAPLVTFLCSDQAAYITRQVIAVDGGLAG